MNEAGCVRTLIVIQTRIADERRPKMKIDKEAHDVLMELVKTAPTGYINFSDYWMEQKEVKKEFAGKLMALLEKMEVE